MAGLYPTGTRPIAALPRVMGLVMSFGVLAAGGVATVAATSSSKANSNMVAGGVGAFNATMGATATATTSMSGLGLMSVTLKGNASSVLNTSGVGAASFPAASKGFVSLSAAGVGGASSTLAAQSRSVVVASCTGVFVPVMFARVSSATLMQGSSTFGGLDSPGSQISFGGIGLFSAIGYAVFIDTEKAGPSYESRVAFAPQGEYRVAVAPSEDRVYYVNSKAASPGPPNRRRIL